MTSFLPGAVRSAARTRFTSRRGLPAPVRYSRQSLPEQRFTARGSPRPWPRPPRPGNGPSSGASLLARTRRLFTGCSLIISANAADLVLDATTPAPTPNLRRNGSFIKPPHFAPVIQQVPPGANPICAAYRTQIGSFAVSHFASNYTRDVTLDSVSKGYFLSSYPGEVLIRDRVLQLGRPSIIADTTTHSDRGLSTFACRPLRDERYC